MRPVDPLPATDVRLEIQVRYHEVDQMGLVYHPRYFSWFEMARLRLLDALGTPYPELERQGLLLPITRAEIEYLRGVELGDTMVVEAALWSLSGARLELEYRLEVGGELRCRARTEHAALDAATRKPRRLPEILTRGFARLPSQGGDLSTVVARDPERVALVVP